MANSALNKSKWFLGEPISGHFIITVDEEEPAIPSIDILGSSLEFLLKDDKSKPDSEALAILTIGDGLTVVSNTSVLYNVVYRIPGSVTSGLVAPSARDTVVTLYYEINNTYDDETEANVLESGTIKIETDRVKTF